MIENMTNEETIAYFKEHNENLVTFAKNENVYDYDKQVIEADYMRRCFEANEKAIKALEQQPCEDCISREAVLKIFDEACYIDGDWYVMRENIEKLPSVTPTRPKGKWIVLDECANEGVYCSECHKKVFKLEFSPTMKWRNFKYCPNCGADMRGDSE